MSELLKGCGVVLLLVAAYWLYAVFNAMGPRPSDIIAAVGFTKMMPAFAMIGGGLLFIAAGVALDRLREIRDASRDALYHLRKLSKDVP